MSVKLGIARCSHGNLGLVTGRKFIRYTDGSGAHAYTGTHIGRGPLFGTYWTSRKPRWIVKVRG